MSLPETRVLRPKTVEEAVRILAENGPDAMILAGGTDVVPNLQMKLFSPRALVDIKPIRALRGIAVEDSGTLRIGALTTLTEIAESPLLAAKYPVLSSAVRSLVLSSAIWEPLAATCVSRRAVAGTTNPTSGANRWAGA